MKLTKFTFIRDIVQSPEWHDEVVRLSDEDQHVMIEALYKDYYDNYLDHDYSVAQFYEEHLQIKYAHNE